MMGKNHSRRAPRLPLLVGGSLLLLILLASFLAPLPGKGAEREPIPLKVTEGLPTFSSIPFFVALKKGFFKEEGLKLDLLRLRAGVDRRDALVSRKVAVASMATTPLIVAASRFPDVRAIGLMSWGGEGQKLVVHTELKGKIKSVKDLAGKRIAMRKGTEIHAKFVGKVLPHYGMTEKDVKIINMNFADMAAALEARQLAAYIVIEPYASAALSRGIGWILLTLGKPEVFSTNFMWWVTNKDFLEKNPEALVRFLRAIARGIDYINVHFDESISIFYDVAYTARGIKGPGKDFVKGEVSRMHYTRETPEIVFTDLHATPKMLHMVGRIKSVPNLSDKIVLDLWKKATMK